MKEKGEVRRKRKQFGFLGPGMAFLPPLRGWGAGGDWPGVSLRSTPVCGLSPLWGLMRGQKAGMPGCGVAARGAGGAATGKTLRGGGGGLTLGREMRRGKRADGEAAGVSPGR